MKLKEKEKGEERKGNDIGRKFIFYMRGFVFFVCGYCD